MKNRKVQERNMIRVGDQVRVRHTSGRITDETVVSISAFGDYPFKVTDSTDPKMPLDLLALQDIVTHRGMRNPAYVPATNEKFEAVMEPAA